MKTAKTNFEQITIIKFKSNCFGYSFIEKTVCDETKTKWKCTDGSVIDKKDEGYEILTEALYAKREQHIAYKNASDLIRYLIYQMKSLGDSRLYEICKDPAFVEQMNAFAKFINDLQTKNN